MQGRFNSSLGFQALRAFTVLLSLVFMLSPAIASAKVFSVRSAEAAPLPISPSNRTVIAQASIGPAFSANKRAVAEPVITDAALAPSVGPLGSALDVASLPQNGGQISVYTVHAGDTISEIAETFGVSVETIRATNDLSKSSSLKEGMQLVILPVSGYEYTIKKGDTIDGLAKRLGVPAAEIRLQNDLGADDSLIAGRKLIIPDAEFYAAEAPTKKTPAAKTLLSKIPSNAAVQDEDGPITVHPLKDTSKVNLGKTLLRPVDISLSTRSRGSHGYGENSADLAADTGTPVMAAANGTILLAKEGGWNSGYGNYIILLSEIGGRKVETIYAHLSEVSVSAGQNVSRGQKIGEVGSTGNSTGSHLHFEVRGALNPLAVSANYTGE